jgi:hypothetical protein
MKKSPARASHTAYLQHTFSPTPLRLRHHAIFHCFVSQGLTEEEAASKGLSFDVYSHTFSPQRAHLAARASPNKPLQRCFVKMLTEPGEGKLLGLHMVGEEAPEIIQVSCEDSCFFALSVVAAPDMLLYTTATICAALLSGLRMVGEEVCTLGAGLCEDADRAWGGKASGAAYGGRGSTRDYAGNLQLAAQVT